ncbi:hypothetical protein JNL27_00380 [bacterium]|nr:hypothetical protein [bacterium]
MLFKNLTLSVFVTVILIFVEAVRFATTKYVYKIDASLPFFLPVPIGFGTFGSVNKILSPLMDRKALYQITYAGSFAGLAIGLILLFGGFDKSEIILANASMTDGYKVNLGSSLLLSLAAKSFFGVEIGSGHMLSVNALTFAGWMVVLITSVSLMPLGELAGGRIARAIFSRIPALIINRVLWFTVLALGILHWSGWLVFAFLVFIVSYGHRTKVFNQISPVSSWQKALGIFMLLFALFVLIPLPHSFYRILGMHCPYL